MLQDSADITASCAVTPFLSDIWSYIKSELQREIQAQMLHWKKEKAHNALHRLRKQLPNGFKSTMTDSVSRT